MLWIKALHVSFMVTWFAGLFYLPRLFVYHADAIDATSRDRFIIMERRLYGIMTLGALLTGVFGLVLVVQLGGLDAGLWSQGWWHAKLLGIALLVGYHLWCRRLMRAFAEGSNRHSQRWYRWFNEVPAVLLLIIVSLVIVRPF